MLAQILTLPGIVITTLLADMAYSDGDVRVAVEEHGTELVAKVAPVTNGGRFPKTDFEIDLEANSVTCPALETTTDARPVTDHKGRAALRFVFAAVTCGACPFQTQCTTAKGGRQITVGVHEARITAARAAQAEPATKALLRRRSKVERKIDHLQDLGMRQARLPGPTKDAPAGAARGHRGQLQAPRCPRRVRHRPPNWPSPPVDRALGPCVCATRAICRRIGPEESSAPPSRTINPIVRRADQRAS